MFSTLANYIAVFNVYSLKWYSSASVHYKKMIVKQKSITGTQYSRVGQRSGNTHHILKRSKKLCQQAHWLGSQLAFALSPLNTLTSLSAV